MLVNAINPNTWLVPYMGPKRLKSEADTRIELKSNLSSILNSNQEQ